MGPWKEPVVRLGGVPYRNAASLYACGRNPLHPRTLREGLQEWSRRPGLNRQPADYKAPRIANKFNGFIGMRRPNRVKAGQTGR